MRGLFITGTDTGVGKTAVTAAIVRQMLAEGIPVGAYKPAASGVEEAPEGPLWRDVEILWRALQGNYPRERICPQVFVAPLAPPVAAEQEGKQVDRQLLRTGLDWWQGRVDAVLIEGAGGLLSPLAEEDSVADVARDLGFPLLIVGRLGLGTINHTMLTVEAARSRGLEVAGIVLNEAVRLAADDTSWQTNAREIQRRCDVPVLSVVRHVLGGDLLEVGELQRIRWELLSQPKKPLATQE